MTVAVAQVMTAADNLPDYQRPGVQRAGARCAGRPAHPGNVVTRAVRSTQGSQEVIRSLKTVRDRYGELMTLAASAPSATLGQRLYTARTAAALSAAEAADAMT